MTFLLASVIFNITQVLSLVLVLFCYFSSIDSNDGMTLPIFITLVFLEGLGLSLISKRWQMGFSLFFIFVKNLIAVLLIDVVIVFFDWQLMFFQALEVDFPNQQVWLEAGFCFYINSLLYHFFQYIQVLSSIIHLSSNKRTKTVLEVVYQSFFIRSRNEVKLFQYNL